MFDEPNMVERVTRAIQRVNEETTGLKYTELTRAMARAAMEEMRFVPDVCYDQYECDKTWSESDSRHVWNRWLDAALKGDG